MCTVPKELAVHKTTTAKGSQRVDSLKLAFIFKTTNTLIPVGDSDSDKRGESVQGEGNALLRCINYHVSLVCITQGSFLPWGCG